MRQGLRRSREMDAPKKVSVKPKANVRQCKLQSQNSDVSSKPSFQPKVKIKLKASQPKRLLKDKPLEKKKTPVTNLSCNLSHASKVSSKQRLKPENPLSYSRNVVSSTVDSFGLHQSYNNYRSFTRPLSPASPQNRPEMPSSAHGTRPNLAATAVCSPVSILQTFDENLKNIKRLRNQNQSNFL